MKKYYEVYLQQHITNSVEDDYETAHFDSTYKGYYADRKLAIEHSMNIGKSQSKGYTFHSREKEGYYSGLDEGLACVRLVCYTETDDTDYERLWHEDYKYGKCLGREE